MTDLTRIKDVNPDFNLNVAYNDAGERMMNDIS